MDVTETITHRGIAGVEQVRGNKNHPERTAWRGICSCGWRSRFRRDTPEEALTDLEKLHGIMTGTQGTQSGWVMP